MSPQLVQRRHFDPAVDQPEAAGVCSFRAITRQATPQPGLTRDNHIDRCPWSVAGPRSCPFGGACHTCPARVQPKLRIGAPDDEYEKEADAVAAQVMRMPNPPAQKFRASILQRTCRTCRENVDLRREASTSSTLSLDPSAAPSIVEEVVRSPGKPLDAATRAFMEPRFGHDFADVQVHSDARAAESASAVNALAFTVGQNIVFGFGQYAPRTQSGAKLIAHELTHVLQQTTRAATTDRVPSSLQRARGRQKNDAPVPLTATIDEDDSTIIVFSRPVTLSEATAYLWRTPPVSPGAIRPAPNEKPASGGYRRFVVDVRNQMDLALSMQHGLANSYIQRIRRNVIRSKAPAPPPLEQQPTPPWLPAAVRDQIVAMSKRGEFGKDLPKVYRFEGEPPWGAIVVWVGPSEFTHDETVIEAAQYYPENKEYYQSRYGEPTARRVRESLAQWNRDFAYYVEGKKMRPSEARLTIREENAKIAVMIIGAFGLAMASGRMPGRPVSSSAGVRPRLPRTLRSPGARTGGTAGGKGAALNAQKIESARSMVHRLRRGGHPVEVNVGGAGAPHEPANAINVNNQIVGRKGIPNHVEANGEEIGTLFAPGSVDAVAGYHMPPSTLGWESIADGAFKILVNGGRFRFDIRGGVSVAEARRIVTALTKAGFRSVDNFMGKNVLFTAIKP